MLNAVNQFAAENASKATGEPENAGEWIQRGFEVVADWASTTNLPNPVLDPVVAARK